MGNRLRSFGVCSLAAGLLASLPLGGAGATTVVNRIVATVDGEPITAHQLETFVRQSGVPDPSTLTSEQRRRALEMLIMDQLMQAESAATGAQASEEEVSRYIEQIKKKNNLDDEKLTEALKAQGMSMEAYRTQVRREIQKSQLVSRQLRAKVNVTPEEVERYYEAHKSEYSSGEGMRVHHIFFRLPADASPDDVARVSARAAQARARIEKGDEFEKVAQEMSEGPEAAKGGDLGEITKGQLLPELETAIAALKDKQVSEPVRTKVGVHIVRLDKRRGEGHRKLDDVKEEIKEKLYAEALEARYQRWFEEDLKKSHSVVIK